MCLCAMIHFAVHLKIMQLCESTIPENKAFLTKITGAWSPRNLAHRGSAKSYTWIFDHLQSQCP